MCVNKKITHAPERKGEAGTHAICHAEGWEFSVACRVWLSPLKRIVMIFAYVFYIRGKNANHHKAKAEPYLLHPVCSIFIDIFIATLA